jgi:DNA-directed RNA polymerase subunit RPC12/RpoP
MDDHDSGWLGDLLLGHEGRQQRDIRRANQQAASSAYAARSLAERAEALQRRLDRLELICETLLHVVLQRGVVDRAELARVMARVDLRDGVEDGGARGEEPLFDAPLCSTCGLPINPRREACVYCDAKIAAAPRQAPEGARRAERMVRCTRCGAEVEERFTVYTDKGLQCDGCHAG